MDWNRKLVIVSEWLWRVSVMLLPWQMRAFIEGQTVNGFIWEQGRLSLYASALVVATTVAVALVSRSTQATSYKLRKTHIVAIALFIIPTVLTLSWQATTQWWMQIALLVAFVFVLQKMNVSREKIAFWFVMSLIPHAFLGVWQFGHQIVIGSKWLGMATQIVSTPGVSVIEVAGARVLRAYGGFPHPNILGGWLAIGLPLTIWLMARAQRSSLMRWSAVLVLFSASLVFSFSRSAWIACIVGLTIVALICLKRTCGTERRKSYIIVALLVTLGTVAYTTYAVRGLIIARVITQTSRLEIKSLDERKQGFVNGWRVFVTHPMFGSGPGAAGLAIGDAKRSQLAQYRDSAPPVLPHFVPLLVLVEFGFVGAVGLILLLIYFLRRVGIAVIILFPLFVLALFDHYLWSLWSGQVLAALSIAIAFCNKKITPPFLSANGQVKSGDSVESVRRLRCLH